MKKVSYVCPFCKKKCNTIIQWQTQSVKYELDLAKHEYNELRKEGGDIEAWCCPYCEKDLPGKLLNTLDLY
jgi:hypothetical protein